MFIDDEDRKSVLWCSCIAHVYVCKCFFRYKFNMKLRGSLLVIVCCLVVEFFNINQIEYLLFKSNLSDRTVSLTGIGLMFLLYPLVGHLTDVYLTRYRSLKWSFTILILAACLCVFSEGIHIAPSRSFRQTAGIIIIVVLVVHTVGLGLFQANAIQFGLDQLLDQNKTETDCFHSLVLLGSECWQFSIILCCGYM